jgi:transposase
VAPGGGSTSFRKFDQQCSVAAGAKEEQHACEWRERAEALEAEQRRLADTVAALSFELERVKRRAAGHKSEKLPRIQDELRAGEPPDFEAVQRKRKERRAEREKLEQVTTVHPVPDAERQCPKCGNDKLRPLGEGKESTVFEYQPARFIAHRHVRETLQCPCGEYVATAPVPEKWVEKSQYAPTFVAHLVTAKCADSIPLYRLEKEYQRVGVPVRRSTMTELFHRAAAQLAPLAARLVTLVRGAEVVHADETSQKVMAEQKCRTGYIWTFRARVPEPLIAYVYAPSRSGETPRTILGGTTGALVVDGYTGYNSVVSVDGRTRVGCHAHVRRYFNDALPSAPEAMRALELIREMYRVDSFALEAGFAGTDKHLELRRAKSAPIRDELKAWLDGAAPQHPPKSLMGTAVRYTLNQWEALGRFLEDARIPLDNNPAESALRRIALGRKNFLFVGHDGAGENLAGLHSLVATCEANAVNPVTYLADVLMRVNSHPASAIDELLPHRWRGPSS